MFVGIGVNKAFASGAVPRDVLAREIPLVLRTEIYATACIAGGIVHTLTYSEWHFPLKHAAMLGMATTLLIRLAAIRWHLKLPVFEFHNRD